MSPTPLTYKTCATETGRIPKGGTKSYECTGKGRYVVVQLKARNYLTLCEVVVLGSKYNVPVPCPTMLITFPHSVDAIYSIPQ